MSPELLMLVVSVLAILQVLLMVALGMSIKSGLARIERKLAGLAPRGEPTPPAAAASDPDEGPTPFDQFIAEDPSRLAMSKSEQSAAFREWRRQNGMSWSNS